MASASTAATARDQAAWRIAGDPDDGSLAAAEALCRRIAERHYENFSVVSRLVPPRLRQPFATVYAFARWSDDLADEAVSPEAGLAALATWRGRLDACFAGRPDHPVFVALAETVRQTGLGPEPFSDLLDAFTEDLRCDAGGILVRYATRDDLVAYCRRSADPVGRIVLALEGCRDPERVALSDAICTGLQLVNFWQDVRRDRRAGRIYLPAADLARHGVDPAALDAPAATPAVRDLLRDEVAWARSCFDRGAVLAEIAPPALRPAIAAFLGGGRAVADAIERAGFDTLARRPVVSRWTKLRLAGRAWWAVARDRWRVGAERHA
jgi:squalene synthase HpnC